MVSIVISSRVDQYLQKTVDDLLQKAEGEIEIIVVLDGYWSDPMLKDDPRVILVHHGEFHDNFGMRASISAGIRVAKGEYIFQIDEHCMVDQGYDVKLAADCEDDWVVIPRRYRLDAEKWDWTINTEGDRRPPIDYMYIEYPYVKKRPDGYFDKTQGLHGAIWNRPDRDHLEIDDTPTMQGSCYFLKKSYWDKLFPNGMEDDKYGPFTQEAQEISMKVWLSGGRVVVNKKTWYAHLHKGKSGKGYGFNRKQYLNKCEWDERGRLYCINHWLYTKDYKYDFNWFVTEKFPDMPGWSKDWLERVKIDREKDYSALGYKDDEWLINLRKNG